MDRHIVIVGKHVDCSIHHLHIDIGVPGHDLSDAVRRRYRDVVRENLLFDSTTSLGACRV